MYFQPYGDEQQLNLNWIINEIINLHKQLDPDYETPSFTQIYPYSNLNRLNLDWILSELKALKQLAPEPAPQIDIQAIAVALVALPFDSTKSYQIFDYISRDGEIWRATEAIAAGGVWDSTKWLKTKIGTDLAILERWINTINSSLSSEIEARQNADTTLQNNINNEALARQQAETALQNTINGLTSANISDDSDAGGATVKESLNNLKGSLQSKTESIDLGTISSTTYPTVAELLEQVFNLVTIYDQPIIVKFSWKGMWQGIVNKYSSGIYGQMLCSHYSDAQDYLCHIVNGNFTVRKISNVLHFNNVTCSAVTGTIITINDDMITSDYVLLNITFSKPTAISQDLTWNTLSGTFTINGSCTDGTCTATVTIGLS